MPIKDKQLSADEEIQKRMERAVGSNPDNDPKTPPNNVQPMKRQEDFSHPDIPDDIYGDED